MNVPEYVLNVATQRRHAFDGHYRWFGNGNGYTIIQQTRCGLVLRYLNQWRDAKPNEGKPCPHCERIANNG